MTTNEWTVRAESAAPEHIKAGIFVALPGWAWPGKARRCVALRGRAWQGKARQGAAGPGKAGRGEARR